MSGEAQKQEVDYTAMDGPALLSALGDDAYRWADAFCQHVKRHAPWINGRPVVLDHGWMITWFANAIEHSHDVRRWRAESAAKGNAQGIVPPIKTLPADAVNPIPECGWRDVPVTTEFLAGVFDAYCGADGHNLVVRQAMAVAKGKLRQDERWP